jgi:hypothetical protein
MSTPAKPTIFVNVHQGQVGLEAFDSVHTSRTEAAQAAEDYSDSYRFTLTDAGKIDLTAEFSEGFHEQRDFDATVDARTDNAKERRLA